MFKGPKPWKEAIDMMPAGPDLSSVQFQHSVNNPNEDIRGTLVKLRVEAMWEEECSCWMT